MDTATQLFAPAICNNLRCRTVWWAPTMFYMEPGDSTTLIDCSIGPCPSCGSMSTIRSGTYTRPGRKTFRPNSAYTVLHDIAELIEQAKAGASPADIEAQISKKSYLSGLKRFAPKTPEQLAGYIAALATLILAIAALTNRKHEEPTPTQQVPSEYLETLEQVFYDLETTQQRNPGQSL